MKKSHFYFSLLLLFITARSYAAADDTVKSHKRISILPVPSFGYSPETKTYVGAVALFTLDYYNDSLTRTSNAKLEFNYTGRKQVILESAWNYFFRKEEWYTQGILHYSRYPDLYYGVGEGIGSEAEVLYESNRLTADVNLLRKVGNRLFLGPRIRYIDYYKLIYTPTTSYAELHDASVAGGGLTLLKDSRNNLLNSTQGWYGEISSTANRFRHTTYAKLITDGRAYKAITDQSVLAARLYNEFTIGDPPFFDYALTGGDKRARGYYFGRYRDRNLSTLQLEYRTKVIWRFGAAVFGGISKLYPDLRSLSFSKLYPNYGAGIRFLIDRKQNINLRFDYALGIDNQNGFYISFGESF